MYVLHDIEHPERYVPFGLSVQSFARNITSVVSSKVGGQGLFSEGGSTRIKCSR